MPGLNKFGSVAYLNEGKPQITGHSVVFSVQFTALVKTIYLHMAVKETHKQTSLLLNYSYIGHFRDWLTPAQ